MSLDNLIDRRVPLALLFAVLLQVVTVVWWAATKESDSRFDNNRITILEKEIAVSKDGQMHVMERLARIEERVNDQLFLLQQIDKRLNAGRK